MSKFLEKITGPTQEEVTRFLQNRLAKYSVNNWIQAARELSRENCAEVSYVEFEKSASDVSYSR